MKLAVAALVAGALGSALLLAIYTSLNGAAPSAEANGNGGPADDAESVPANDAAPAIKTIDFAKDVLPIFEQHCYACHGPDLQESNYRLDSKKAALAAADFGDPPIVAGKSRLSPLYQFITGENDFGITMPPEGKGKPLSDEQIATLRHWIDAGAPWPEEHAGVDPDKITTEHWSFQPVVRPPVPEIAGNDWGANAIDRFILEKLLAAQLAPSPRADRVTLIRRLYLDMLGLPPAPEEIDAFVNDTSDDAWPQLVERVLASPHYGERWARHWLDVARFAESDGFETNHERRSAYHYRDYVIRALNDDKPFNEFIVEQLAGDAVGADAATGFLVGGPRDAVGSPDITLQLMQRQDELADMVGTTSTTFLGLTLACARCHNHKFDPILQKDYYALEAVFAGVRHGERTVLGDEPTQKRLAQTMEEIGAIERRLAVHAPLAHSGNTIVFHGGSAPAVDNGPGVVHFAPPSGSANFVGGGERGRSGDLGGVGRLPHLAGENYDFWWIDANAPLRGYRPGAAGTFRVWVSWAAGHDSHAPSVEYVLDADGDPATVGDQTVVARVDQRNFSDGGETPKPVSVSSGFFDAGRHAFNEASLLFIRRGEAAGAVASGVIVLQEEIPAANEENARELPAAPQPAIRAAAQSRRNVERFAPVRAKFVRFVIHATNSGSEPCIDELEVWTTETEGPSRNVASLGEGTIATSSGNYANNPRHRLHHVHDGKFGNDFSWISNTHGQGWVQLEFLQPVEIDRIAWGRDRDEVYSDRTATQYEVQTALEPGDWKRVASHGDRIETNSVPAAAAGFQFARLDREWVPQVEAALVRLAALEKERATLQAASKTNIYAGAFEQPGATHRLHRGDPMSKLEPVAPDIPTVSGSLELPDDLPEQERRLRLARWIASAENPLSARVMVNRVWQYHFGAGLVDTPSDFGGNGARPTHPELLDWLADEFVAANWSLKHVHRLILLSETYRQSAAPREAAARIDAGVRLWWRYPPRRLEAEAIRDSILAVSGALDLTMGGPGFMLIKENDNYARNWEPKEEFGPAEFRRMVYATKIRMEQDSVFGVFDCPDAGQTAPKRSRSTTALQALNLLNSPFMLQQANLLAERLRREAGDDIDAQIIRAFRLTTGRTPDEEELAASRELIERHDLPTFCRAILNANEFLFIP